MIKKITLILLIFVLTAGSLSAAKPDTVRVGYFEPGSYLMTRDMLRLIYREVERIGGDSLRFLFEPYAYKSAEWKRNICRAMAGDLARMKDIDMVIAAGPWVIGDLLDAGYDKPIIGIYQFDPVAAGYLDKDYKPVAENLTLNFDPGRVSRDLSIINRYFPGANIGFTYFPYQDEFEKVAGRIKTLGEQLGHKVIVGEHYDNEGVYGYFGARKQIADSVGVFYAPPLWSLEADRIRQFFSEAHFARKPVYTYDGYILLDRGAFFCGTNYPNRSLARFTVDKMAAIVSGSTPAELQVVFEDITTICMNLDEASKMGRKFSPYDLLGVKIIPAKNENFGSRYDLDFARNQAISENADLQAIEQTYQQAIHEAGRAKGEYFPKVSIRGGAAATDKEAEASVYNRILNREIFADITADQKVFSYHSIKVIHAAKKNLAIKEIDLEEARDELELAVTTAYFAVLENEDMVDLYRERLEQLRTLHTDALTSFRLGYRDSIDAAILENYLNEAQVDYLRASSELRKSQGLFNILVNRPTDITLALDRERLSPEIMAEMVLRLEEFTRDYETRERFESLLLKRGVENSYTLQRSDQRMARQRDLISANKARSYPELSVRARYSYGEEYSPELNPGKSNWTIGGILTFPILDGWKRVNKGKVMRAEMELMAYKKDAQRLQLMQEISSLTESLFTQMLTLPQNYNIRNTGRTNFDAMMGKFNRDEIDIQRLLFAFDHQYGREIELIHARYGFFTVYAELLHAVGESFMLYGTEADRNFYARLQIDMTK